MHPTEHHARVLGNIAAGMRELSGFECVSNGWVSHGKLTDAGKAILAKPLKVTKWQVTVMPETPEAQSE